MNSLVKFFSRNLTARLAGYFALVMLIGTILIGYLAYSGVRVTVLSSTVGQLQAVANLKEDALDRWVEEQRRNVILIGSLPEVRQWVEILLNSNPSDATIRQNAYEQLSEYLKSAVANLSDLRELAIVDLDGIVVLSTDKISEGQNWSQEPFFVRGRSVLYVQNVYLSRQNGEPMMSIAMPLFDTSRRRMAVLVCHLNIERLERIILERSGLNMRGEVYLINSDRQFVSVSPAHRQQAVSPYSQGIDAALAHKDGFGEYTNYTGTPVIGVYRWLEHRELALLVEVPRFPVYQPALRMMVNLVLIGGTTGVLLSIGLVFFSRRIMRRMRILAQDVNRTLHGFSGEVAGNTDEDEVSSLNRVFLQVADKIRSQESEIQRQNIAFDKAQKDSRRREAQLRMLVEYVPDVLIQLKQDGDIVYLSPSVEKVLGYLPPELLGQDIMEYVLPEDWATVRAIMQEICEDPSQVKRFEFRFRHKDRIYRVMEGLGRIVDCDDELFLLLSLRDITQRRLRK